MRSFLQLVGRRHVRRASIAGVGSLASVVAAQQRRGRGDTGRPVLGVRPQWWSKGYQTMVVPAGSEQTWFGFEKSPTRAGRQRFTCPVPPAVATAPSSSRGTRVYVPGVGGGRVPDCRICRRRPWWFRSSSYLLACDLAERTSRQTARGVKIQRANSSTCPSPRGCHDSLALDKAPCGSRSMSRHSIRGGVRVRRSRQPPLR